MLLSFFMENNLCNFLFTCLDDFNSLKHSGKNLLRRVDSPLLRKEAKMKRQS